MRKKQRAAPSHESAFLARNLAEISRQRDKMFNRILRFKPRNLLEEIPQSANRDRAKEIGSIPTPLFSPVVSAINSNPQNIPALFREDSTHPSSDIAGDMYCPIVTYSYPFPPFNRTMRSLSLSLSLSLGRNILHNIENESPTRCLRASHTSRSKCFPNVLRLHFHLCQGRHV